MQNEREVGIKAVCAAARVCEAVRDEMVHGNRAGKLDKGDRSPVTVADFGAQAVVCRHIEGAFPHDVIVAEEDSAMLRQNTEHLAAVTRFVQAEADDATTQTVCQWIDRGSGKPGARFWVLDPIDGTKGFLRQDQYAVALALIVDGVVQLGFLACPALPHENGTGAVFAAQRGGGTHMLELDGAVLGAAKVSRVADVRRARLAESVESGHTNHGLSAQMHAALHIVADPVRMDSQAKYAAVARGQADIYLRAPNDRTPDYRECIWDHAAGWLVVTEAGGTVTDVYGEALDWTQGRRLQRNKGVLATNGQLHGVVLETLAALLPPR